MIQDYKFSINDSVCSTYSNDIFMVLHPLLDLDSSINVNVKKHKPDHLNMTYFCQHRVKHT
jgi:hypothetical protein